MNKKTIMSIIAVLVIFVIIIIISLILLNLENGENEKPSNEKEIIQTEQISQVKDNNLFGIFEWWEQEKDNMIFNTTTRNTIETCLSRLKTLLNKEVDKYNEGRIKNEDN